MEMAMAAFSAIGSAVSAAAPAMSTVTTILQGATTAGSVLMGLRSGAQQSSAGVYEAQDLKFKSEMLRLDAEQQENASRARAVDLKRDALQKIGAARVAFSAAGGGGLQLDRIEDTLTSELAYGLEIERTNRGIAKAKNALERSQLSIAAGSAVAAGASGASVDYLGSLVKGGEGLLSILNRK